MTPDTMTLNLRPNPELASQTTQLVSLAEFYIVTTPEESVEASEFLSRIQKLRRWIDGIYKDAKTPLTTAKRTLDAQHKLLLNPLADAEQLVMKRIVAFTAQQNALRQEKESAALKEAQADALAEQRRQAERIRILADQVTTSTAASVALHAQADMIEQAPTLVMPTPVIMDATLSQGVQQRTNYSAKVENLRDLIMGVAAQIMVSEYQLDDSTRRFLVENFLPTPQCSLSLVEASTPQLNTLARALRQDLNIPGVMLEKNVSLVAK